MRAAAVAPATTACSRGGGGPPRGCRSPALLHRAVCVLLCAAAAAAPLHPAAGAVSDENATHSYGWARGADSSLAGPCTVERRAVAELSQAEFDAEAKPVVLTGLASNARFRDQCARERLLQAWGDHVIVLSTANTYSYAKVRMPLRQYVAQHLAPQPVGRSGRETLYHFGDNNHTEWLPLLSTYVRPPFIPGTASVALSFGLAGPGSGVPFHIHGAGYSETLVNRKRWLLYPPKQRPQFDPDESTLAWLRRWQAGALRNPPPLDCTLSPGEAIYFPSNWWHATLNVDESVFMSSFVSYAPAPATTLPRKAGGSPLPYADLAPAPERELRR